MLLGIIRRHLTKNGQINPLVAMTLFMVSITAFSNLMSSMQKLRWLSLKRFDANERLARVMETLNQKSYESPALAVGAFTLGPSCTEAVRKELGEDLCVPELHGLHYSITQNEVAIGTLKQIELGFDGASLPVRIYAFKYKDF